MTAKNDSAVPAIYGAISRVMAKVTSVGKDQTNQQQRFKFRGIDDVQNAMHGPMTEEGVFCVPAVMEHHREERASKSGGILAFVTVKVEYTFYATDGSFVKCVMAGEAMDSGDKATSKAVSIAMKYALLETFCIPTEEEKDPDAQTHEPAPRPQPVKPEVAMGGLQSEAGRKFILTFPDAAAALAELAKSRTVTPAAETYIKGLFGDGQAGPGAP